jgi:hypothetical protein
MIFDADRFEHLYQIMFSPGYAGYTPAMAEAPNGDGVVDVQKRYAHLAKKYLPGVTNYDRSFCEEVLEQCVDEARDLAGAIDIPTKFWPTIEDSTLRLLEYPPGATSAQHTDFDLFTLNLYRSHGEYLVPRSYMHVGELMEVVTGQKATSHHVDAHPTQTQRSVVFFAMPPLDAVLPTGVTVRDWLTERKARSRVAK